jgi:spore coat polysaccharide biosynthesis protein SpsF
MHSVAIIQARMGSTRLPGKVLKPLAGQPVLAHVVKRVMAANQIDEVVVATSTEPADDAIETFCNEHGWQCIRGSERDVLARYAKAARIARADVVVRVTSDCPLFSPRILDDMLDRFDPEQMDYMSTNYPTRSFPVGLDCEIMRTDALLQADADAKDAYDREHVTPYLYNNPALFRVHGFANDQDLLDLRITLDTAKDYHRLVDLTTAHPELANPDQDVLDVLKTYFQFN